jgi:hypothetical protein
MPRWLQVAVALSLLVLALVAARAVFALPTNPRITKESYDRLQEARNREEVEAILGSPGDYRTGPTKPNTTTAVIGDPSRPDVRLVWQGDEAEIWVWVDPDPPEGVSAVGFYRTGPLQVGVLHWLKWRWERWRNGSAP